MIDLEEINLLPDRTDKTGRKIRVARKCILASRIKRPKWKRQLKGYSKTHFDKANKLVKP